MRFVRVAIVLAVMVAVAALPTAASAVPGMQWVLRSSPLDSSEYKTVSVPCPAGTRVLGGGAVPHWSYGNILLMAMEPVPSSSGDRFVAAARERVPISESWKLDAYAICAPAPAGWQVVSNSSTTQLAGGFYGGAGHLGQACPSGKVLLSAGGRITTNVAGIGMAGLELIDPHYRTPAASLWNIMPNAQLWGSLARTVSAVCANPVPGFQVVTGTGSFAGPGWAGFNIACPAGKRVHGIGVSADTGVLGGFYPTSDLTGAGGQGYTYGNTDWFRLLTYQISCAP